MLTRLLVTVPFVIVLALSAPAATLYVPDNYTTIQKAILAAAPGDTVIVRPSFIYFENIDFLGKEITVKSQEGARQTTIEGIGSGPVVTLTGAGPQAVLEGFYIKGGSSVLGGGIYCLNSFATIRDNRISGNVAVNGSGIYCESSSPVITGNEISDNYADPLGSAGFGGGVFCLLGSPIVTGNTIVDNDSCYGGGIYFENANGEISGNLIARNTVTDAGYGTAYGGGINCITSSPLIKGNRIRENLCVSPSYPVGGGIYCTTGSAPTIEGNIIEKNELRAGSQGYGAGIYCDNNSDPTVWYNVLTGNRSTLYGGGIACVETQPVVVDNVFLDNFAAGQGGGIFCLATAASVRPIVTNNTLHGNVSPAGGGLYASMASPYVANCIFWNSGFPPIALATGSGATFTFCDIQGGWTGTGNIDIDPLLVDAGGGDVHLTYGSPCIGAGLNTALGITPFDMEGDPRITMKTVDIGADEFWFHLYHVGTVEPGQPVRLGVVGQPGTGPVLLGVGSDVRNPPLSTIHGDFHLLAPFKLFTFGTIPSGGVLTVTGTAPGTWTPGEEYPLQALIGPKGAPGSRFTNLLLLPVE